MRLKATYREPAPEGKHTAVLADVIDLGVVKTSFGDKEQVRLVWELDATNHVTGKRHEAIQTYAATTSDQGKLRPALEAILGRRIDDREFTGEGFNPETLIGFNCSLVIVHEVSKSSGRVYAKVVSVSTLPEDAPRITIKDYVRSDFHARTAVNGEGNGEGDAEPNGRAANASLPREPQPVATGEADADLDF